MVSIPDLAAPLQSLLTTTADAAAEASGLIRRRRKVTGATFVQHCVFGWLAHPDASLSQLARTAACGLAISPQGLDQRFTEAAAACLKRVLDAALPLLRRFAGVWVWDSSTITLPGGGGGGAGGARRRAGRRRPPRGRRRAAGRAACGRWWCGGHGPPRPAP
jgi:hypothetical protein